MKTIVLDLRPELFTMVRLGPDADIPWWVTSSAFFSVTRSATELSIVCDETSLPRAAEEHPRLRCLAVRGTIDLTEVGVISSLATPLAEAGISIFSISTFDTDYLFVPDASVEQAVAALQAAGHEVHREASPDAHGRTR